MGREGGGRWRVWMGGARVMGVTAWAMAALVVLRSALIESVLVKGGVVEGKRAEPRLLGLERTRRQLERFDLRIAGDWGYGLGHGWTLKKQTCTLHAAIAKKKGRRQPFRMPQKPVWN